MYFLYRISNNSYNKPKLSNASKEQCFVNFLEHLFTPQDRLLVIADNVNEQLRHFLVKRLPANATLREVNTGSNAASFRLQLDLVQELPDEELVMLHEDDYLYRGHAGDTPEQKHNRLALQEALAKADYVSLYDHPDKYLAPAQGGNPLINVQGMESVKLFLTAHSHWKLTNSTTLTFAVKAQTLKADQAIWLKHVSGTHPHDYPAFLELGAAGRTIATPIPGLASNTEPPWLSPLYDWERIGS